MKKLAKTIIKFMVLITIIKVTNGYAQAQDSLAPYLPLLPNGTDLSLLVQTVEKNPATILAYQNDQFKQPASVQKLITALAAELELGRDFRFITRLQTNGKITNKQLNGDLVVQMSGDPTFNRKQLREMLSVLKLKGIDKINGNIIIDSSIFAGHDKASGWSWNNLTSCYNTAPSAIIIDGNCFYAGILPAPKIGEKATTSVSAIYPIKLTSNVRTISNLSDAVEDKYCELDMTTSDKNHYNLSGCIKHSSQKSYLKFAVADGFNYFASILKTELAQKKVKFTGKIIETKEPIIVSLVPLATNQSAPLSDLLTIMLKKSNNLIADTVFRTIGAHYFNMPGTWQNSSDAIKAILLKKANIDLENAVIVDGSGLSRLNLIDANKLMQVLQYIAANNDALQMIAMLPVAGVDGTLQYRKSFSNNGLKSIIYAKTGYLEGNYNLAGFIKTKENHYIAFIQFISGYHYMTDDNKPQNSAIIEFEKNLYQNLLNTN
ncbi:D-Ala-D-Ala peptidase C [Orbus hercynius]|uniref:D-Ala-D-Ala peptidase C n=1 Tax=Orbus hercynius TaxID=593135 RepID=A0A495RF08_9GAMM|nr:serine-type D-Ala-D-Ala carboxypeptidase [Orbus hercynius]RKS85961.1 D-Ala-D-Ala peptidase C [Orbus hercynius]